MRGLRKVNGRILLAVAAAAAAGAAGAQEVPEIPQVISPLRVETDHNGVNMVDGQTQIPLPVLSAPGAPNLRFDRIQNAAPYVSGTINAGGGGYSTASFSVHTGSGTEAFRCIDFDCTSVTGTGSGFVQNSRTYRQGGTGAQWTFNLKHVDTITSNPRQQLYYASSASYPNGETISYTYQTATLPGDTFNRTFYRPTKVSSNHGYFISITYHPGELGTQGWNSPASAILYASAAPTVPLGRLAYNLDGTITQYGAQDQSPRTYTCSGCSNALGSDIEVTAGTSQLPTEGAPYLQVAQLSPTQRVISSVTRDGVAWNYAYANLRYDAQSDSYWYDSVTVTGPDSFSQTYNFTVSDRRNVLTSIRDPLNRTTSYLIDGAFRPTRVTSPEGNRIDVAYDEFGNVTSRTATPKAGSGLTAVAESAFYPTDDFSMCNTLFISNVRCYRPLWSRDGLNRQTDYVYNDRGQLTQQDNPADASGVRRRTIIEYEVAANGVSRRRVVRVCGVTTTCGTANEIRTEYQYGTHTLLPTLVRRISGAQTLDTTYAYDGAGRITVEDGPLTGTGDAKYFHYDSHGRRIWEIDAANTAGVRTARRFTYRNSDDKLERTEEGTVTNPAVPVLTALRQTDIAYDARRNPKREAVSSGGTTRTLVQRTFDQSNRLVCEAQRMNPAVFATVTEDACALGPQGTGANAFGPDRITRNIYDAAGQLTQVQRAYRITTANGFPETLQQNYATYTYSLNGRRTSVTDANGNRADLRYDGFDRQNRWVFPSPTVAGAVNEADYEAYTYDAVGNRLTLRKRDGTTINYAYDNLNRVRVKTVPASASGAPGYSVHYGYDVQGQQLFARFGSPSGQGIANEYDGFGRLTATTSDMDGTARRMPFSYDAAGNRTQIGEGANYIGYSYDPAGRMLTVTVGGNQVARLDYDTFGRQQTASSLTSGNPVATTGHSYDTLSRLQSLTIGMAGTNGDQTLTFAYNPDSQITTRTGTNDAYASNTAYNVDRDYSVNGLNQYSAAGTATFLYDANGNLRSDGTNTYVYDAENRLVSASGAHNATLSYDPLGRLWQIVSPAGTRQFRYYGDQLSNEVDAAGNLVNAYIHGPGADEPLVWYVPGARRFLHANHQGSIVGASNHTGALIAINGYDAWGIPNAGNVGRLQYTGQMWLSELGMYHYKARLYSPTLGRFMQTDPVGYDDQIHLYAYVGNDPLNWTDTSGERTTCNDDKTICQTVVEGEGLQGREPIRATNVTSENRRTTTAVTPPAIRQSGAEMAPLVRQEMGNERIYRSDVTTDADGNTIVTNTDVTGAAGPDWASPRQGSLQGAEAVMHVEPLASTSATRPGLGDIAIPDRFGIPNIALRGNNATAVEISRGAVQIRALNHSSTSGFRDRARDYQERRTTERVRRGY